MVSEVWCIHVQVIGNKHKKLTFLSAGAVHRLVEVLSQHGKQKPQEACDQDFIADAVCILGSLGYNTGPDGLADFLSSGGMECLVSTLEGNDNKAVGAALRALKLICQVCEACCLEDHVHAYRWLLP